MDFFFGAEEGAMGYKMRDVEVFFDGHRCIVTACDSCGAVGSKELDVVRVSNEQVGRLTARVALLEVLSVGAIAKVLTAAISAERNPTGEAILDGIRGLLTESGLEDLAVAVSTEKNFVTRQTGLGISVVGICDTSDLRIGMTKPNDTLYCLGYPKVGSELSGEGEAGIASISDVLRITGLPEVHDILPVGSKGILSEAAILANASRCRIRLRRESGMDLERSAGPSTCVLVSCKGDFDLAFHTTCPVTKIGDLEPLVLRNIST